MLLLTQGWSCTNLPWQSAFVFPFLILLQGHRATPMELQYLSDLFVMVETLTQQCFINRLMYMLLCACGYVTTCWPPPTPTIVHPVKRELAAGVSAILLAVGCSTPFPARILSSLFSAEKESNECSYCHSSLCCIQRKTLPSKTSQ